MILKKNANSNQRKGSLSFDLSFLYYQAIKDIF
ncbi:Uncharacterised protein [Escherichia coli]|nr:Uncharacterised protein [Escherichia coli]